MKNGRIYLVHIAECIEKIAQYTAEDESEIPADSETRFICNRKFRCVK